MDGEAYKDLQSGSIILLTTTLGGLILLVYLVWGRAKSSKVAGSLKEDNIRSICRVFRKI